jgi:methylated-DNA-[protein]-cysteine S-methyltransferase
MTSTPLPPDLDRRFRERAADEGLLDAAWDIAESPIGPLLLAVTPRGLAWVGFEAPRAGSGPVASGTPAGVTAAVAADAQLERVAAWLGRRVLRVPRLLDPAQRQLDAYFAGRLHAFDLDVDLAALPAFQQAVLQELRAVPYGTTATYGELAQRIGRPGAARAVGGALNRNPVAIVVPCHRIVGSAGALTGYAGGLERKRALLELEGALLA